MKSLKSDAYVDGKNRWLIREFENIDHETIKFLDEVRYRQFIKSRAYADFFWQVSEWQFASSIFIWGCTTTQLSAGQFITSLRRSATSCLGRSVETHGTPMPAYLLMCKPTLRTQRALLENISSKIVRVLID